jgi:hypothetical protein
MVAIPSQLSIPLLLQDASDILLGALLQPTWGVYLNGQPVLQPAAFGGASMSSFSGSLATVVQVAGTIGNLSSAFASAFSGGGGLGSIINGLNSIVLPAIASTIEFEYPQEQGAFTSYNKATLPFDVRLRVCCGGSVSKRQAFLTTCQAIKDSLQLFSVVTPEMVFSSCNCTHISWRRTAQKNNQLIEVDLGFVQVRVVSATSLFNFTSAPGDAGQQGLGTVQGLTAPVSIGIRSFTGGATSWNPDKLF